MSTAAPTRPCGVFAGLAILTASVSPSSRVDGVLATECHQLPGRQQRFGLHGQRHPPAEPGDDRVGQLMGGGDEMARSHRGVHACVRSQADWRSPCASSLIAALEGELENVFHAVALDRMTAALTLEDSRAMTEELRAAYADRLPERLREG